MIKQSGKHYRFRALFMVVNALEKLDLMQDFSDTHIFDPDAFDDLLRCPDGSRVIGLIPK